MEQAYGVLNDSDGFNNIWSSYVKVGNWSPPFRPTLAFQTEQLSAQI